LPAIDVQIMYKAKVLLLGPAEVIFCYINYNVYRVKKIIDCIAPLGRNHYAPWVVTS